MKTALFLTGDYWHPTATLRPLAELLFTADAWRVMFTEDPQELWRLDSAPDLFLSFKDPIENDQIPTPVWCTKTWTDRLLTCAREGRRRKLSYKSKRSVKVPPEDWVRIEHAHTPIVSPEDYARAQALLSAHRRS